MHISVDIPDDLAAQLEARGLVLDAYVTDLVREKLQREQVDGGQRGKAVEAMLHFVRDHGTAPTGSDIKSLMHEGHRY